MTTARRWDGAGMMVAATLLGAGCGGSARAALSPADLAPVEAPAPPSAPPPPPAEELYGKIDVDPDGTAEVTATAEGRIARLYVAEGQRVRAGQLLAEIESPAAAELRGRYDVAMVALHTAQANSRRQDDLADAGLASRREAEIAALEQAAARAQLGSARAELAAIGCPNGARGRGTLVPLRAPITGTVVRRRLTRGEGVRAGAAAFRIVDLDRLVVRLRLAEHTTVPVGARYAIAGDGGFEPRVAVLAQIAPAADPATHTVDAIATLPAHGRAFVGQLVTARRIGPGAQTAPAGGEEEESGAAAGAAVSSFMISSQ